MFSQLSSFKGEQIIVELASGKQLAGTVKEVDMKYLRLETAEGICAVSMPAIQIIWEKAPAETLAYGAMAADAQKTEADLQQLCTLMHSRPCTAAFSQPCMQMYGQQPSQPCYQMFGGGQQPCMQMYGQQPCPQGFAQNCPQAFLPQSEPYGCYGRFGHYGRPWGPWGGGWGGGFPYPYPYPYPYPPYPYPYPYPYDEQAGGADQQTSKEAKQ